MGGKAEESKGGFQDFLYNPEDGTVMGRNFSSWAKILSFYAIYYSGLFVLFYAFTIQYYSNSVPTVSEGNGPFVKTRTDQPGAHVYPFERTTRDSARWSQVTLSDKAAGKVTSYDQYEEYLTEYFGKKTSSNDGAVACETAAADYNQDKKTWGNQKQCQLMEPPTDDQVKAAMEQKQPFVALELNKIIGWQPKNRFNVPGNVPTGIKAMEKNQNAVYVTCVQYDSKHGKVAEKPTGTVKFWNKLTKKADLDFGVIQAGFFPFSGNTATSPDLKSCPAGSSGCGISVYNKPYVVAQVAPIGDSWAQPKDSDFAEFRCEFWADNMDRPSQLKDKDVAKEAAYRAIGVADFGFHFN